VTPSRKAVWALAATTVLWGSTFVIVRELVAPPSQGAPFPPHLLLALRFALAAAILLGILFVKKQRVSPQAWSRGAVLGVLVCGGFAFQTVGLQHTTSAHSAFITNTSLLMIPFFGIALGRRWPGTATFLGLLFALGGLWLLEFPFDLRADLLPPGAATQEAMIRGDLLTLGCAVCFAFQILATESFSPKTDLLSLVFVQFLTSAAIGTGLSIGFGELSQEIPLPGGAAAVMSGVVYLGAICTAGCLLVQAWAQRYTSATRAAMIFALEPIVATALAYFVLNERLTAVQIVGALLVLFGILATEILASRGTAHDDSMRPLAPAVYDEEIRA